MLIPGFSNYDISESGVVTCLSKNRVIKHIKARVYGYYTYLQVSLVDDTGKRRSCNVMRLLALTYLDKPEQLCTARPKDGDNTNLALSNIEWVPYTAQSKQAWHRNRDRNKSSKKRQSSVTEESITLLYDTLCLYDEPVNMVELSHALDIPYSTVRYSMYALMQRGKAIKLVTGFAVKR